MMRFIVTKQNTDGTFDGTGMRNRILRPSRKLAEDAARTWMREGHRVRVEGWDLESFYNPWEKPSHLSFFG